MNALYRVDSKRPTTRLALIVAVLFGFLMGSILPDGVANAAGAGRGGGGSGDQIQTQLQLKDGSCDDSLLVNILEGDEDQDQLRLQDGSCSDGCDGDPDQDQIRDRFGW